MVNRALGARIKAGSSGVGQAGSSMNNVNPDPYRKMQQHLTKEFLTMLKGRETHSFNKVRFRARQILLQEMLDEIGEHKKVAIAARNLDHLAHMKVRWNEMALDVMAANDCILALSALQ